MLCKKIKVVCLILLSLLILFALYIAYIKLLSPYIFENYESARYKLSGIYITPPEEIKYYDLSSSNNNGLPYKEIYYRNVAEKGYDNYKAEIQSRPKYYSELIAIHENENKSFDFRYVRITEKGIEFDREEKNLRYYDDIKYYPLSTVYYLFGFLGNDTDHQLIRINISPIKDGSWYSQMKPVAFCAPTINPLHWMPESESNIIGFGVFNIEAKSYMGGLNLPKDATVLTGNPSNQDVSKAIDKMQNDLQYYANNKYEQDQKRNSETMKFIKGVEEVSKYQGY